MASYICSAVFHDLTLIASQQWLLFLFAGLNVTLGQAALVPRAIEVHEPRMTSAKRTPPGQPAVAPDAIPSARRGKAAVKLCEAVPLFGMRISRVTTRETVDRMLRWCAEPRGRACRYVVTPNVDHAVLFQSRDDLRDAYAGASLVLADGAPIVLASRLLGQSLPERVAGSDLVPHLLASARLPLRVYLLGAAPGVAESAAVRIERQWPHARVVGTYSPPLGFERDEAENDRILSAVAAARPDLLIVGFGAPKQELWIYRHHRRLQAKVAICAGATIDFLAGHRRRSPIWMRRAGLEWLHRVWCEPRRLAARYARDAWIFPRLVWREWRRCRELDRATWGAE